MKCAACGHENREGATFCRECAAPLAEANTCPKCGTSGERGQKFCDACGAQLQGSGSRVQPVAPTADRVAANSLPPRSYTPKHLADKILKIAGALLLLDPSFAEILPAMFEFMGVPDAARPAARIAPEAARRRMLEHFGRIVRADNRDRTVVTLVEDLHWLDAASDRFVAELVEIAPATRMLVLLNFRPEYAAEWIERSTVQQIALQPLGPEAVREMLAGTLGNDPSVRGLPQRIHARTDGNPFFTEEILQTLIEDGSLAGTPGAYRLTHGLEKVPLPRPCRACWPRASTVSSRATSGSCRRPP